MYEHNDYIIDLAYFNLYSGTINALLSQQNLHDSVFLNAVLPTALQVCVITSIHVEVYTFIAVSLTLTYFIVTGVFENDTESFISMS